MAHERLTKAFDLANAEDAAAVVPFMQADMWDPTAKLDGNALAHALHPSTPVAENVTRMVVEEAMAERSTYA